MNLKNLISKVIPAPVIHGSRYILDGDYRRKSQEKTRLRMMPRYQSAMINFFDKPVEIVDSVSFLDMYEDIFKQQTYRFQTSHSTPFIIDGGANIGLSTLYFKKLYPNSRIIAFEADEEIFGVLKRNVQGWGYNDVELNCRALWSSETSLSFSPEGSYAGRLSITGDVQGKLTPTVRLRSYLDRPVSLLKLDIEGAETEVLTDCADLLGNVENMFVEYHSFPGVRQSLGTIISIITNVGFRFHVHSLSHSPQPLFHRSVAYGMDMQLNIFAFR